MFVCDAQVHAPAVPEDRAAVRGASEEELLVNMKRLGIDRAVLVPLAFENDACFQYVADSPETFGVMVVPDLHRGEDGYVEVSSRIGSVGMLGVRASFYAPAERRLLQEGRLEWLWRHLSADGLPVMVNAPNSLSHIADVATRYPDLRLIVDHMGLTPFVRYADFEEVTGAMLRLGDLANVSVKVSGLLDNVADEYPYRSVWPSVRSCIDRFGLGRVFWGSDYTRVREHTYDDALKMFTESRAGLDEDELRSVLGEAICEYLAWDHA